HSLHHPPTLLSYCYVHHRLLHSFPTRRSSDLAATITPLVATGVTTFTMGNLSMGSGSALTIAADAGSLANTAYNLTLGATTLAGPATFNVLNNGTGTGQLTLGALNDGGTARTVTAAGPGTLVLAGAATSLVNGTQVNVTGG